MSSECYGHADVVTDTIETDSGEQDVLVCTRCLLMVPADLRQKFEETDCDEWYDDVNSMTPGDELPTYIPRDQRA